MVKENLNLPVYMIVRPYRSDYMCSDAEFQIMCEEIKLAKQVGIDGFVFGVLSRYLHVTLSSVEEGYFPVPA